MKQQIFDTTTVSKIQSLNLKIKGLVQGVGFRPFVYRHAGIFKLNGWVDNCNEGVEIRIEGEQKAIENFVSTLRIAAPSASKIEHIEWEIRENQGFKDFKILKSKEIDTKRITEVSPDIAVCPVCLRDIKIQENRLNYPFINCTNCGPRFSILRNLPYDRKNTSMHEFSMCLQCENEYTEVNNRRFHAQPIACQICGPQYELIIHGESTSEISVILSKIAFLIDTANIIAIKGLGGFHLMCDALQESAVKRLRAAKQRETKPFALMFRNLESVKEYVEISKEEERLITSWQRPIVLLTQKKALVHSINLGLDKLGCFLPYLPLHYLIFEHLKTDLIVLTSGNMADEPIAINNDEAIQNLSKIYDAILINNREIVNRLDDSVCMIANEKVNLIRRSRSFAPTPLYSNYNLEGIFAAGAELSNCFAIGKENKAIVSQYIGDLKNLETFRFYQQSYINFSHLFRFSPNLIVQDLHPDYLSTKFAKNLKMNTLAVQHHHAHIASAMFENNLDETVIGIAFDGSGLGDDRTIWGGEFLICDLLHFKRITHFEAIPMPGADKVATQAWRSALAYLYTYYKNSIWEIDYVKSLPKLKVEMLIQAIDQKINCPLSSSAGRLFDAVSALLGLCQNSSFHSEAPMLLEAVITKSVTESYTFENNTFISFKLVFDQILADIKEGKNPGIISAKFHNTLVGIILQTAIKIRSDSNLNKIVLSGGCFQNKYLIEKTDIYLTKLGFEVFTQQKYPSNDGGIALGQMAIAAKNRNQKYEL